MPVTIQKPNVKKATNGKADYFVADLSLADWGRREIEVAEHPDYEAALESAKQLAG